MDDWVSLLAELKLDRRSNLAIPTQIYLALRDAVLDCRLPIGARLLSTRELARRLQVARAGVVEAFERLVAEGYLVSRIGAGTYIANWSANTKQHRLQSSPPKLARTAQRLIDAYQRVSVDLDQLRPFKLGVPALDQAPLARWGTLLRASCLQARPRMLDSGDALGLAELRSRLAERLFRTRSIVCSPDQIAIVSGAQQAFDLIARLLIEPGDKVWVEDPGYSGARGAWIAAGARVAPIRVDALGIDVAYGERIAPRARLAYVTPSHQFPTGVTMRLERRLALIAWAQKNGAVIIEDDYDSEFQFEGASQAALFSLAKQTCVIYVGTFSKTLFPAVRLGYVVLPNSLVDAFRAVRHFADGFVATLVQHAAARFLAEGHFDRHLRHVRAICSLRREALLVAAHRHLKGIAEVDLADSGLHMVVWLPDGISDCRAQEAAARAGIETIAISALAMRHQNRNGLVLGFAAFAPHHLRAAIEQLAVILRSNRSKTFQ
jgi:GntR family transcriptional regulator/MocR family aminotransferase